MKKTCLIFLFLISQTICTSQNNIEIEKEAEQLFEIIKKNRIYSVDSILIYCKKIEVLESKTKSVKITAFKNAAQALFYLEQFKLNEAEKKTLMALHSFEKLKNLNQIAFLKSILGRIYQNRSDYVKASNYFFESNTIAKKYNYSAIEILNTKNLAFLFLDQKNIKKALFYGFEAQQKALKINDNIELGFAKGVIAEIYRSNNELNKSEIYFKHSYAIFNKLKLSFGIAWTLTNWSLLESHGFEKSFKMRKEAQEIWNTIAPNNIMSIANQYNIGYDFFDLYLLEKNSKQLKEYNVSKKQLLDSTFFYINKSLSIAELQNNTIWKMYCYGTLTEAYFFKNDLKNYSKFNDKYHFLKDSLFSQENKNKIAEKEASLVVELRDKQLKINKLALESKEKQKWFYILGLGFLGILGGLLFYQSYNRKKVNEKLQVLNLNLDQANKTKTRFFSILNHDLRAPVSNLIGFLHLQKENPELLDEQSKLRLQDKTISGAENLLTSMEDILLWSKGQMENFKPQPKKTSVENLFDDTKKHFASEEKVAISFENPENISINTDENYLKTIIRNLTGNAIKALDTSTALSGTKNPKVVWKSWQEKNYTFLSISDNGKGATQDQFKALYDDTQVVGIKSGLGLHLIRDLAKAIDCEISVDSKENFGTTFTLKL